MKCIALTLTVLTVLAVFSTSAKAGDNGFGRYVAPRNYASNHAVLNHRAEHRAVQRQNARHDYPTTLYQHTRTRARLNRQATHDRVRHHAARDRRAYSPAIVYGRGLGHGRGHAGFSIRTPHVSILLGH